MKISEVFRKAKKLIETRGWVQGMSYSGSGAMCVGAALARASADEIYLTPRVEFCRANNLESYVCAIEDWNDAYGRTESSILAALDKAAAYADANNLEVGS